MSPLRFTPLHPAHPGRIQDDGARQVSWLAGSLLGPPSQEKSQWLFRTSLAGYSCGGSADFIWAVRLSPDALPRSLDLARAGLMRRKGFRVKFRRSRADNTP